jgi:23S rRNA pseudouridine2605 synthase
VRLNAYLARAGVASRRSADELIKAGRVTVNGEPGRLNTFVESRDRVEVDGRRVEPQRLAYLLLHKPAGVVTTARDPHGRPTVVDLVDHEARVVPVGRLDADTMTDEELLRSRGGVELEDGPTAPAQARRLGPNRLELVLHEGRKHQVKRMCAEVGLPVTRLHRPSYGGLELGALAPGEWRELEPTEVEQLRAVTTRSRARTRTRE